MSKGYNQNKERQESISSLGKDLARRSKSKCELCDEGHRPLNPIEVAPVPETPCIEHAVLICDTCNEQIKNGKLEPQNWRFLESVIWSEIPAVQVTAIRICQLLSENGVSWAEELLSNVYLSPEIEEWLA